MAKSKKHFACGTFNFCNQSFINIFGALNFLFFQEARKFCKSNLFTLIIPIYNNYIPAFNFLSFYINIQ